MATFKRASPRITAPVTPSPRWGDPLLTHGSTEDPAPNTAARSGSVSWGVTAPFSWVMVCTRFCLCPPKVEFLFPPSYGNPTAKSCWPSKSDTLGIPNPYASSPSWKAWHGSSEPSLEGENLFGAMVLQFVGCPSSGYGIWFYHDCTPLTILLQLILCLSTWGMFFLVVSSILLSTVVQQLVVILVISREETSTCPSTPPSWINLLKIVWDLHRNRHLEQENRKRVEISEISQSLMVN